MIKYDKLDIVLSVRLLVIRLTSSNLSYSCLFNLDIHWYIIYLIKLKYFKYYTTFVYGTVVAVIVC